MKDRLDILNAAKARMKALEFGDPVTNVCAGENNPRKHAYFVQFVTKSSTNKWGIEHKEYHAKCTDKKGNFWNAGIETLYPGTLDEKTCNELFAPIWEAHHGKRD
jgi:hypothetical protein